MQQWEYLMVDVADSHGWKVRSVNGSEVPNWRNGPLISAYLNQMGGEGWELIAWSVVENTVTSYAQEPARFQAVLKRPMS